MPRWVGTKHRTIGGTGVVAAVALTATVLASSLGTGARLGAAQDDSPPDVILLEATPPAADDPVAVAEATAEALRGEVAALSTEVARLASDEDPALAGRLGGERGGFTVAYGAPLAYVGPDDVVYEIAIGEEPDITGRATVSFNEGRADRIVIVPARPLEQALDEPSDRDWTPEIVTTALTAFLPDDAGFDDGEIDPAAVDEATGSSTLLAATSTPAAPGACPGSGAAGFAVAFTRPTAETISAVTLEFTGAAGGGALAAGELVEAEQGRTQGGASAVANSSLGGVVTVNGVRVEAFNVRPDAEIEAAPPADGSLFAVELAVGNNTERPLTYQPSDFILVDGDGQELSASCGGVEPGITAGEIAPGDAIEGWITFVLPDDFSPERFVFLAADARVGFDL